MNLERKVIVITGAAKGFGKALSLALSQKGALVAGLDTDKEALKELSSLESNIFPHFCDISNAKQVEQVISQIDSHFGEIDIVINNAGLMKNSLLINLLNKEDRKHSISVWHDIISVNQDGVFFVTRSAVEKMIEKRVKGVIVNISSISASGNIGQTAYSASKAAVEAMSNVWSKELGRFGIRSVCVAPGFIDTAGTHNAVEERMLARWIEQTPMRRTGEIEEVVSTVLFAIENDFITGTTLSVNGGLTI